MAWSEQWITKVAVSTAGEDYAAFEAIGLQAIGDARVLDVGCFDGFNTRFKFAPYRNIACVVGIDPDAERIECARERYGGERFSFAACAFEDYEPDEPFDVVYFSHVLQHLGNPAEAVAKAYRLLKPGGFIVVKTVDDGAKVSYPDPHDALGRVLSLYDRHVLPNVSWTARTDRYLGRKCLTLFANAGFGNIAVASFPADTAGKTRAERLELFERCMYFRRAVPEGMDPAAAQALARALGELEELFERDDYYFATTSTVAVGQRLGPGENGRAYCDGPFGSSAAPACYGDGRMPAAHPAGVRAGAAPAQAGGADGEWHAGRSASVRPMRETDIPAVMMIEVEAFQDPWTPLAYLTELRYNPVARYEVLEDETGAVAGYAGVWRSAEGIHLARIAVDAAQRAKGYGGLLLDAVFAYALECGLPVVTLEVRSSNRTARAFYRAAGFEEADVWERYYADPPDDAIVMAKSLERLGADR